MPELLRELLDTLGNHRYLSAMLGAALILAVVLIVWAVVSLWQEHRAIQALLNAVESERDDRKDVELKLDEWAKRHKGRVAGRIPQWMKRLRRLQNPDVGEVSRMAQAPLLGRVSGLRTLPNMLFLVGLFATVVGLTGSIGSLSGPLQQAANTVDPRNLTEALSGTLGQMRGTFAFTIVGVLLAVTSNIGVSLAVLYAAWVARQAQDLTLSVAAYALPSSQAAQLEDLQRLLRESRDFMLEVSGTMSAASQEFQSVLARAADNLDTSTTKLAGVAGQVTTSLIQVTENAARASERMESGAKQIGDGVGVLRAAQGDLRNAFNDVQKLIERAQKDFLVLSEKQLNGIEAAGMRVMDSNLTLVNKLGGLQTDLKDTLQRFDAAGHTYTRETLGLLNKMDGGFRGVGEQLDGILEKHRGQLTDVAGRLDHIQDAMRDVSERLDPRLLPKVDWAAAFQNLQGLRGDLQMWRGAPQQVAAAVETLKAIALTSETHKEVGLGTMRALDAVPNIVTRLQTLEQRNEQVAKSIVQLHGHLADLPVAFDATVSRLGQEVGQSNSTLKSIEKILLGVRITPQPNVPRI